jgi:hypothetical protein
MAEGNGDGVLVLGPTKPKVVAKVSIRIGEVLAVEDLLEDNPAYTIANTEPRKRVSGCMAALRGAPRAVRMNQTRQEVLAVVDPDGTLFREFDWQDLDGRKAG